jgi:hypothetical protein
MSVWHSSKAHSPLENNRALPHVLRSWDNEETWIFWNTDEGIPFNIKHTISYVANDCQYAATWLPHQTHICFWRKSPSFGQGLLIHEVSRSHTTNHIR